MAKLLSPDKRHIKASSDFHLSFFLIFIWIFFTEKRSFSVSKHI